MRLPRARLTVRWLLLGVALLALLATALRPYLIPQLAIDFSIPGAHAVLPGAEREVRSLVFSADGRTLAAAGIEGSITLWDPDSAWPLASIPTSGRPIFALALTSDGRANAVSGSDREAPKASDRTLRLMRVRTGLLPFPDMGSIETRVGVDDPRLYSGLSLAFAPDGLSFASGGWKTVEIRDRTTYRLLKTLRGGFDLPSCLSFSPDGRLLAVGDRNGVVALIDMTLGRPRFIRPTANGSDPKATESADQHGHSMSVNALIFDRDGQRLLSLGHDNHIKI